MPRQPINFGNNQESGSDELAGASPLAVNVTIDSKGAVRRRPGMSLWSKQPTMPWAGDVVGIHKFYGYLWVVQEQVAGKRTLTQINESATAATASSASDNSLTDSFLWGSERPSFAVTSKRMAIAGGDDPLQIRTGDTYATALGTYGLLGYMPPASSAIVGFQNRLFSNDLTSTATQTHIRFSGLGEVSQEDWDTLDWVTAAAKEDEIVGLVENSGEIFCFKERVFQVFSPDAFSVLAPSRAITRGCANQSCIIQADDALYWFDPVGRTFLGTDGRSIKDIGAPMSATMDTVETISDCWGFRAMVGQNDLLVWVFPSDGRTFCYQIGGGWSQWHGWDGTGHSLWPGLSAFDDQNNLFIGSTGGNLLVMDNSSLDDNGTTFKSEVRTGFIDHGSQATKQCLGLYLRLRRGGSSSGGKLLVSWRDNLGPFCPPVVVDLGTPGDYAHTVAVRAGGTYRARQWRIEMTDSVGLVLAGAEEDFKPGSL